MIFDFLKKKRVISKSRFQDIIFLVGIFTFSAVLILGLFPTSETEMEVGRTYYLFLMMTIPVIAAVYFIIVSFRRKLYSGTSEISSSIRFKIGLAFVFVAIIPSLPIIILSNKLINHTITEWISEKDTLAMEESLKMANEAITRNHDDVRFRLDTIREHGLYASYPAILRREKSLMKQGYHFLLYTRSDPGGFMLLTDKKDSRPYSAGIGKLLGALPPAEGTRIYNTSIAEKSLIVGALRQGNDVLVLYRTNPDTIFSRISLYEEALGRYRQREFLKPYFQTGMGIFLLLLSIVIIAVSIGMSYLLSQGITRPVYELVAAARRIAAGDFNIRLRRDSQDELALLFSSFNRMASQLEESKVVMYQKQKLQAWREIARKLVHEIKNPLTPIRLSAERIQKRYGERHQDLDTIVMTGTATIIDEVNTLMEIIGEFSRFARLPEMKPERGDINEKITSCANFFLGNERIEFHLALDEKAPQMYFDRILIRQAMTNLIQNAVDSIKDRGNIWIGTSLVTAQQRAMLRISVKDDGAGIREEDLQRIFEPTFSSKEHGTGLGLAIVEKIVFEHKGRTHCASRPGEGAEFIIELPILTIEELNGKDTDS